MTALLNRNTWLYSFGTLNVLTGLQFLYDPASALKSWGVEIVNEEKASATTGCISKISRLFGLCSVLFGAVTYIFSYVNHQPSLKLFFPLRVLASVVQFALLHKINWLTKPALVISVPELLGDIYFTVAQPEID